MTDAAPETPDPALRPRSTDLVEWLDARLHQARVLQQYGEGAAHPVVFRQWRVERRLGRGGMGAVYLAVDQGLRRAVALKVLPRPGTADHRAQRARAEREAQSLAKIKHHNVVGVHQIHLEGDSPIIEMEYIDGPTLRTWQSASQRPWQTIVSMYVTAGEGIAALHHAGLVHRDIKPDNLLVAPDGSVRVVDLGLAWASDRPGDATEVSRDDAVAGTFGYMAPEVFVGAEPDPRSDQFSFCVALYEALFGVRPYHGTSPSELARAMGTGRLTPPDPARPAPAWLHRALRRGLHCDRHARHPSIDHLLRALRRGLARRRTWTRRLGVLGGTVCALGLGWCLRRHPVDPCAAADVVAPLAPAQLESLRSRISGADPPAQRALASLAATLDARAETWSDGRLCRAAQRDDADKDMLLRWWACLDTSHDDIVAMLDALPDGGGDVAGELLATAAAIDQLPDCADSSTLARWPAPELARRDAVLATSLSAALRHERAGEYHAAEGLARAVAAAAGPRRRAEALYRLGHLLGAEGRSIAASTALDAARNAADALGADELRCRIVAYQAKLIASADLDATESERSLAVAEACIDRTHARAPLLRADMLEARGLFAAAAGRPDLAIASHTEALELRRAHLGQRHEEVSKSLHNLGNALSDAGRYDQALMFLEAAVALRSDLLGPDHPRVGDILHDLGHVHIDMGHLAAARQAFERAEAILRATGGPHTPALADFYMALAALDLEEHQPLAAQTRLRRARELQAIDPDLAPAHTQRLALLALEARLHESRGDFASALRPLTTATAILRSLDPSSDDLPRSIANEIVPRFALHDYAGIAALAHDAGPRLLDHLRRRPPDERGPLAWYIGDSLLHENVDLAAEPYLTLALAAYHEQRDTSSVTQLHHQLARIRHTRPSPP